MCGFDAIEKMPEIVFHVRQQTERYFRRRGRESDERTEDEQCKDMAEFIRFPVYRIHSLGTRRIADRRCKTRQPLKYVFCSAHIRTLYNRFSASIFL